MKRIKSQKLVKVCGDSFIIQRISGEEMTNAQGSLVGSDYSADFRRSGTYRALIVGAGVVKGPNGWPFKYEMEDLKGNVTRVTITAKNAGELPPAYLDGLFEAIDTFNSAGK